MVIPNRCHDGSDKPRAGAPAVDRSDEVPRRASLPKIMSSKEYLDGGVIAITLTSRRRAAGSALQVAATQPTYPNLSLPSGHRAAPTAPRLRRTHRDWPRAHRAATGESGPTGSDRPRQAKARWPLPQSPGTPPGGGKVGLLLLSPYIKAGNMDLT